MKPFTLPVLAVASFAAGVAFVVACSDDGPGNADAASCSCPAAEPPLAGRIVPITASKAIPANGGALASAGCPQGAVLLGGGCRLNITGAVVLEEAGPNRDSPSQPAYWCSWKSSAADARMGTAEAICLMPAQ